MIISTIPKCCFCIINLRKGAIIIGILTLVGAVLDLGNYYNLTRGLERDENEDEENRKQRIKATFVVVIGLILSLLLICLGITIINGAVKRRPKFMAFGSIAFLVYGLLALTLGLSFFITKGQTWKIIHGSVCFLLGLYFALVLWSFYKQLTEARRPEQETQTQQQAEDVEA